MTICYFGLYARNYVRNRTLLKGLQQNNVTVIECNDRGHFIYGARYLKLIIKFIALKAWRADVIFVGFPGQTDVPLAWIFGKLFGKKVIFDAFYSMYVSQIFDRKHATDDSFKAKIYWLIDWLSCTLSDKVILDTNVHCNYFSKEFNIPRKKFFRLLVGTDTGIIKPTRIRPHKGFIVGFHGSFLPLQGVPTILSAAKLLKQTNIKFHLLGNGIEFAKCEKIVKDERITNVRFYPEVVYEELAKFISAADVYLGGPFGNSLKSNQVIPNKVYEGLAVRKPVILGNSKAMKELLHNRVHGYYVKQGSARDLAKAILYLKGHKLLREKISKEGYNLVHRQLTPRHLAQVLISIINTP